MQFYESEMEAEEEENVFQEKIKELEAENRSLKASLSEKGAQKKGAERSGV